jgi:putative spermidine/putrescine transport system substrate-binding protein
MKRVFWIFLLLIVVLASLGLSVAKETLVIQIWPGSYEEVYTKYVIEPFEEKYGVDVVTTTGLEWYTLAKILEEVASGHPRLDVVQVTVSDYMRGVEMEIWEELNPENIPNLEDIYERYRAPYGVGFETYEMGLVYNKLTGKPKPLSLADFWNPIYNVAIGKTHEQYFIPMVNHMLTGRFTPVDLDAVFAKLEELKPNIVAIPETHAEFRILLAAEEMDLAPAFNNRVGKMIDDGMEVEYVGFPSVFVGVDYWGIVKGSPHKEIAEKFINYTLSVEAQLANALHQYLGPTNKKVKLEHDFVVTRGIAYGIRLEGKMTMDDYKYIAEHLDEWTERWIRWLAGF